MKKRGFSPLRVAAAVAGVIAALTLVTVQPLAGAERSGPEVHVDPARLEATVRTLVEKWGQATFLRNPDAGSPAEAERVAQKSSLSPFSDRLDATAAWLMAELGPSATEQTWQVDGRTYRNVSALFGPASAERVVVGAHYDTCEGLPGADDNTSGVAGALELARLFAASPPPAQVEVVFWSLEEPPFFRTPNMGSVVHAAALAKQGVRVKAMLSLEMIGYFSDAPGSQHFPIGALGLVYPTTASYVAVVGDLGQLGLARAVKRAMAGASDLPVASINAPKVIPGVDWSDHRSYWAQGWPAVMITDTALNRNANYHLATDTPDTLDYARMAKVVAGAHSAIWALTTP